MYKADEEVVGEGLEGPPVLDLGLRLVNLQELLDVLWLHHPQGIHFNPEVLS